MPPCAGGRGIFPLLLNRAIKLHFYWTLASCVYILNYKPPNSLMQRHLMSLLDFNLFTKQS